MPKHITPAALRDHLKSAGVDALYEAGWDTERIDPYGSRFTPVGVVLHHTAGVSSLAYCLRGSFPPVRNCHFLVDRDGTVHVLAGSGCYHAGEGGPMRVNGVDVPQDAGNRFFYGVEVESLGRKGHVDATGTDRDGFTAAQVKATTELAAALVSLVGGDETAVIRHKDWAPLRKVDVQQPLSFWRGRVKDSLAAQAPPAPAKAAKSTPTLWDGVKPALAAVRRTERDDTARTPASWRLACRLADLGHYDGAPQPNGTQGYPRVAVEAFQSASGLPAAGGYPADVHALLFGGTP